MTMRIIQGDMLEELPKLVAAGERFHACVTDPPYHLTSIVKRFGSPTAAAAQFGTDGAFSRASRGFMGTQWDGGNIAFRPETWRLVFDALLPGAYLIACSGCRTYHRIACAVEDAGFIIHPMLAWLFGTGFPKAHKVDAEGWEGWRYGLQSLKPALEPALLAQKPMSEKNGTANVLRHSTGALNIEASRIPGSFCSGWSKSGSKASENIAMGNPNYRRDAKPDNPPGRWPSNVLLDGSAEVLAAFPADCPSGRHISLATAPKTKSVFGDFVRPSAEWVGFPDSGSAARFFWSSKADAKDRAGSGHPTIKPVDLIRYLVRLITPPGGHVLDCFAGSGTTGEAAMLCGFDCTLIEREPQYVADIRKRIAGWSGADTPLFSEATPYKDERQAELFG